MFCQKCGRELENNKNNCEFCNGSEITQNNSDDIDLEIIPDITNDVKKAKKNSLLKSIVVAIVIYVFASFFFDYSWQESLIQDVKPFSQSDLTYEQAFDNFFEETKWESFRTDDMEKIIEFNGKTSDNITFRIQFLIENDIYEISYCDVNGVAISLAEATEIIKSIFVQ